MAYKGKLGSIQKFVDNTLDKEMYPALLASQDIEVQQLKLFWFITGQWDTDVDNLLFKSDGKPVAIDNANISNQQKTCAYGKPTFVKTFKFEGDDHGSVDAPVTIEGMAEEVFTNVISIFKDDLPQDIRENLEKKKDWIHFSYFVEDKFVWRDFYPFDEVQAYFMKDFSKTALDKCSSITHASNTGIFDEVIDESLNIATENGIILESEALRENLIVHFATIYSEIKARYTMVKNFWHDQHPVTENARADKICAFETFETTTLGNTDD